MSEAGFTKWLMDGGQVTIPNRLLQKIQILNLPPESLGYLILALGRSREEHDPERLVKDRWIMWAVSEGWASWEGKGPAKAVTFAPLWDKLYREWERAAHKTQQPREDFDYVKIVRWMDKMRGSMTVTLQDKQNLQEFNLKYGWSTDFIIAFLELYFERTNYRGKNYDRLAHKVYKNGVDTVSGLITFMNQQDWTNHKVEEIKQYIGKSAVTLGEKEMYLKWQNQWKLSHELILKGAQALTRTNRPNFNYLDKILEDWWQKGIKEPTAAEELLKQKAPEMKPEALGKAGNTRRRVAPVGNRDLNKILGLE